MIAKCLNCNRDYDQETQGAICPHDVGGPNSLPPWPKPKALKAGLSMHDLESLSSWLRCYPVAGREDERKRLTEVVEAELQIRQRSERIRSGLTLDGTVQIPEWEPEHHEDEPTYNDLRYK